VASDSTGRIRVRADSRGIRIEIAPPFSDPSLRRRIVLFGSLLGVLGFLALLRLSSEWQLVVRGAPGAFPFPLLLLATVSVLFAPFAVLGLLNLLFAEETIEIGPEASVQEIEVFGKVRRKSLPGGAHLRIGWTRLPVAPWWTWTFHRLVVSAEGRRHGVGATLGTLEKAHLAAVLKDVIE
jgi:hypothetical protein